MGAPAKPRGDEVGPVVMLMLAALGAAVAFAPSWDSYVLRTASGTSESITAGNAFANPAPMIAGDVVVMVVLVAVVVMAALWRPIRYGAALLAGAIIPMVAQAISALIAVGETTSPTLFGISPAQASAAGLTISNGADPGVLDLLRVRRRDDRIVRLDADDAARGRARAAAPVAALSRAGGLTGRQAGLARIRAGRPGVQGRLPRRPKGAASRTAA